jgi:hypothetical protein
MAFSSVWLWLFEKVFWYEIKVKLIFNTLWFGMFIYVFILEKKKKKNKCYQTIS